MQINLIDLAKEKNDNKQFEVLIVPGGMIVYRTKWGSTIDGQSMMTQTATFVPLVEAQGYEIKKFLYGE